MYTVYDFKNGEGDIAMSSSLDMWVIISLRGGLSLGFAERELLSFLVLRHIGKWARCFWEALCFFFFFFPFLFAVSLSVFVLSMPRLPFERSFLCAKHRRAFDR